MPGMADIVANNGKEFQTYIDFVTSASSMPFCIDAWVMKPKLEGAAYCAEKGLLDRMFYNSLTVWEKDVETEIARSPGLASNTSCWWPLIQWTRSRRTDHRYPETPGRHREGWRQV